MVGTLVADLLLGDVHSLKEKRAVVRPIVAELRRRFDVSAAETGDHDLLPALRRSRWHWSPRTTRTPSRCSTAASDCSPGGPRSNCCRRGTGCSTTTTWD